MISIKEKEKWRNWLIQNPTKSEELFLRKLQSIEELKGKFEFQAIVHGFISDFWFPASKLVVEIDGSIHNNPQQFKRDAFRNEILKGYNIKTIRISNHLIYENIDRAVFKITSNLRHAHKRLPKNSKYRHNFLLDHINRNHGVAQTNEMRYKARSRGPRKKP